MAMITLLKDIQIGSGGFSTVYRATERGSERLVALKQSRVSLRVKRTLLHHECRVLKVLSGHTAIPRVFAYGRIEHFEVFSMELLHRSLGEVVEENGTFALDACRDVVDQLLAALEHVHTRGIVHRDIKPDNILLRHPGQWQVCLIDFGLAIRPRKNTDSEARPLQPDTLGLFGTLPYASLNAHDRIDLSYRDDLESLAYTLIWLLKGGNLPWSHYLEHGTRVGRLRQVHEHKKRYNGTKLAVGLPMEYGMLLDYARSLKVDQMPDYAEFRERFRQSSTNPLNPHRRGTSNNSGIPKPQYSPAKVGQLILIRLLSAMSIEGHSGQVGHEASYVHAYPPDDDQAPWRPAVVIGIQWNRDVQLHRVTVVAVGRRPSGVEEDENSYLLAVPISSNPSSETVTIQGPEWPYHDSRCYVFKEPSSFYCPPMQRVIPSYWEMDDAGIQSLNKKLVPRRDPFARAEEILSSETQVRHHARMKRGGVRLYAELSDFTASSEELEWMGCRAWFDECVAAARRRDLDNGWWWTGADFPPNEARSDLDLSDSYRGSDYEDWEDRQQERDKSLTLGGDLDGDAIESTVEGLDEIIALEPEHEE